MPAELQRVRQILQDNRVVAVLGAHVNVSKPAYYVPQYLFDQGYTIVPVNPGYVGETLFEHPVAASLAELEQPIDIVDVFRRSEAVPAHLDDILAMNPLPKVVWLQSGIRNDEVAAKLREAGIEVIQNRCMLADHRNLML